jgi:hypothetical protein
MSFGRRILTCLILVGHSRRTAMWLVQSMLPDTGERHLSTPLFANVPAEMTAEELKISQSTPSAHFAV